MTGRDPETDPLVRLRQIVAELRLEAECTSRPALTLVEGHTRIRRSKRRASLTLVKQRADDGE